MYIINDIVAILCHLLTMYSACILLTTALNLEGIGVNKVSRVCRNKESAIKVSFEKFRTYDEASGVTFADAHHYQHTEEGSHSLHKVDVEMPIAPSVSLMLNF